MDVPFVVYMLSNVIQIDINANDWLARLCLEKKSDNEFRITDIEKCKQMLSVYCTEAVSDMLFDARMNALSEEETNDMKEGDKLMLRRQLRYKLLPLIGQLFSSTEVLQEIVTNESISADMNNENPDINENNPLA